VQVQPGRRHGHGLQLAALALFSRLWPATTFLLRLPPSTGAVAQLRMASALHMRDRSQRLRIARPTCPVSSFEWLVSMLGNLALMRILVHDAHLPCSSQQSRDSLCSIVNFCLGDHWSFARRTKAVQRKEQFHGAVANRARLLWHGGTLTLKRRGMSATLLSRHIEASSPRESAQAAANQSTRLRNSLVRSTIC